MTLKLDCLNDYFCTISTAEFDQKIRVDFRSKSAGVEFRVVFITANQVSELNGFVELPVVELSSTDYQQNATVDIITQFYYNI